MGDRHGPMRTGRFKVEIDDIEVSGWRTIELPSSKTEEGEYREGDEPDWEKNIWGQTTFSALEMERGVQPGDTRIYDWREEVRMGDLDNGRKKVAVILMDQEGQDVLKWEFEDAWIKAYRPGKLSASADDDVLTESISVVFDTVTRTDL
ncbi:phage tail protein [Natrialbaceae archaeon A-CW3]